MMGWQFPPFMRKTSVESGGFFLIKIRTNDFCDLAFLKQILMPAYPPLFHHTPHKPDFKPLVRQHRHLLHNTADKLSSNSSREISCARSPSIARVNSSTVA